MFQLVTFSFGYFLSAIYWSDSSGLIWWGLFGTLIISAGSCVANNILERHLDAKMDRTRQRVLPAKKVSLSSAVIYCSLLLFLGTFILFTFTNVSTTIFALLTVVLYVMVYTPLKTVTWVNTFIGAIPGALVPVGGWVANNPQLTIISSVVFMILFVWQLPHFFAIAWMYKEDYKKAGFKMLPEIDATGDRTSRQMIFNSVLLILVAAFPFMFKMTSTFYLIVSVLAGGYLLESCITFSKNKTKLQAKVVMKRSIIYLPIILVGLVVDHYFKDLYTSFILSL